tara:strand:- start:480 stop:968 length:489 start_codon:yes stop_codon:yes gene_type:complete
LKSRLWNLDNDYDTLVKWWKDWNFGKVPLEVLPPLGIMIENDNGPICAAGLYVGTGTKFCIMEWLVKDKNASLKDSHKAIQMCVDQVMELAKENGCTLMYTVTADDALEKRYTRMHGMTLAETGVRTYIKDLNNTYEDLLWIQDDEQWNKSRGLDGNNIDRV